MENFIFCAVLVEQSKMKSFAKVVASFEQWTIYSKNFILYVWEGFEYAFEWEFYIIIQN